MPYIRYIRPSMISKSPHFRKFFDAALVPAIVILVGLTAFVLGRLSALQEQKGKIEVYEPSPSEPRVLGATAGEYVASKSGTKYYLATCSGAKQIQEENKIWFPSSQAARSAGYSPAANCPGL